MLEGLEHVSHRQSRIDYILDDNDRTVCNVYVQADYLADFTRCVGAHIRRQLDEGHFARHIYLAKEVGCEDERAVQYSQEDGHFAFVVAIDPVCNVPDLTLYRPLGNGYGECLVFDFDDSSSFHNACCYFGLEFVHHGLFKSRGALFLFEPEVAAPRTRLNVSGVICRKLAMWTIGALRMISGFSRSSLS